MGERATSSRVAISSVSSLQLGGEAGTARPPLPSRVLGACVENRTRPPRVATESQHQLVACSRIHDPRRGARSPAESGSRTRSASGRRSAPPGSERVARGAEDGIRTRVAWMAPTNSAVELLPRRPSGKSRTCLNLVPNQAGSRYPTPGQWRRWVSNPRGLPCKGWLQPSGFPVRSATGNRTPLSSVKNSDAHHCTTAPQRRASDSNRTRERQRFSRPRQLPELHHSP